MEALERLFLRRFRGVNTLGAVPSSSQTADTDEFDADRFSERFSDVSLKAGVGGEPERGREGGSQGLGIRSSSVPGGVTAGSASGSTSPLADSVSSGEIVDAELQVFPDSVARWLNAAAARMVSCGESVRCVEAYR